MEGSFTLFSDFNCPFCYALHERLLQLQLIDRCDWKGVQHAPHLPVPLTPWQGSLNAELRHEVSVVRRLAPELPLTMPVGKPNSAKAVAFAAEQLERDRVSGLALVRKIYRTFWFEGRDISDQRVLVEIAGDSLGESSGNGSGIARAWALAWEATGQGSVPLVVAPTGDLLVGCVPSEEIRKFFATCQ